MGQERECRKCKKEFPLTAEYYHRMGEGFVHYCKSCRSQMQKEYKRKGKVVGDRKRRRVDHQGQKAGTVARPTLMTRATPEEIISALRKGVAEEIIQTVRERFGL